jgi:hypothetical protein
MIIRLAANDESPENSRIVKIHRNAAGELSVTRFGLEIPAVYLVNNEFRNKAIRQQEIIGGKLVSLHYDILYIMNFFPSNPDTVKRIIQCAPQLFRPCFRRIAFSLSQLRPSQQVPMITQAEILREQFPNLQRIVIVLPEWHFVPQTNTVFRLMTAEQRPKFITNWNDKMNVIIRGLV